MKNEAIKNEIENLLRSTELEGIEDLIKYLNDSDFYTAPCSTIYHGSYEGGLAEHSLNVYNAFNFLYDNLKDSDFNLPEIDPISITLITLLHDLCKINTYQPSTKNKKVYHENGSKQDNGGRYDWEVVDVYERKPLLPMGHGGKSVFIIQQFIKLSTEEAQAIFWHMGGFDISPYQTLGEMGTTYENNLMAFLLHQADMLSTYFLENENYKK